MAPTKRQRRTKGVGAQVKYHFNLKGHPEPPSMRMLEITFLTLLV